MLETNKIIAEFYNGEEANYYNFPQFGYITASGEWKTEFFHNDLKFHKDWNWLMSVVQKINTIDDYRFTVEINSMDTNIHDLKNGGFVFQSECKWQPDELINSVYEAVVQFINYYKKQ